MRAIRKPLMMRGMVLLHYGMMVVLFAVCWQLFYRHAAAGSVFGAVDISVYAFYAVSLLMLSRIYSAYRVGLLHVGDLLYGQTLANLISLGLTYLLACVLARKLINPLAGFGCAAVQTKWIRAARPSPTTGMRPRRDARAAGALKPSRS